MNPIFGYASLGIALIIFVFIIYMTRQDNKVKGANSAAYGSNDPNTKVYI